MARKNVAWVRVRYDGDGTIFFHFSFFFTTTQNEMGKKVMSVTTGACGSILQTVVHELKLMLSLWNYALSYKSICTSVAAAQHTDMQTSFQLQTWPLTSWPVTYFCVHMLLLYLFLCVLFVLFVLHVLSLPMATQFSCFMEYILLNLNLNLNFRSLASRPLLMAWLLLCIIHVLPCDAPRYLITPLPLISHHSCRSLAAGQYGRDIIMLNRTGRRRQPWQTPTVVLKNSPGWLMRSMALLEFYNFIFSASMT